MKKISSCEPSWRQPSNAQKFNHQPSKSEKFNRQVTVPLKLTHWLYAKMSGNKIQKSRVVICR